MGRYPWHWLRVVRWTRRAQEGYRFARSATVHVSRRRVRCVHHSAGSVRLILLLWVMAVIRNFIDTVKQLTVSFIALLLVWGLLNAMNGPAGTPPANHASVNSLTGNCQVSILAEDGGSQADRADADEWTRRLCDVLTRPHPDTEPTLSPAAQVSARQACIELQQQGWGPPEKDCNQIDPDSKFYHR